MNYPAEPISSSVGIIGAVIASVLLSWILFHEGGRAIREWIRRRQK
jgi:hypothetical protein